MELEADLLALADESRDDDARVDIWGVLDGDEWRVILRKPQRDDLPRHTYGTWR